ncbi:MAG: four helix bundle protein [bacterium]
MNYGKNDKITNFTDLNAWKYGHQLVLNIYKITDKFPDKERFSLIDQMRRAVVSITSNIAEGFSRKSSKEKSQFYSMSLGSLTELQNQLMVARDVRYLRLDDYQVAHDLSVVVSKIINGLIKGVINRNS